MDLNSISIVEQDVYGDWLFAWVYPSMDQPHEKFVMEVCADIFGLKLTIFRCVKPPQDFNLVDFEQVGFICCEHLRINQLLHMFLRRHWSWFLLVSILRNFKLY